MSDAREMNETQRRLARHALGLPNDRKQSYRNRYSASPIGEAHNAWLGLQQRGLADSMPGKSSLVHFYLTHDGATAALEPGESLDPEDFPRQALRGSPHD